MQEKKDEASKLFYEQVRPKIVKIYKTLDEEVDYHQVKLNKRIKEIVSHIVEQIIVLTILGILVAVASFFFALFISRSIKKPVTELKGALEKVAHGDLSVDIKAENKDELGMISQSLKEAITSIKN